MLLLCGLLNGCEKDCHHPRSLVRVDFNTSQALCLAYPREGSRRWDTPTSRVVRHKRITGTVVVVVFRLVIHRADGRLEVPVMCLQRVSGCVCIL